MKNGGAPHESNILNYSSKRKAFWSVQILLREIFSLFGGNQKPTFTLVNFGQLASETSGFDNTVTCYSVCQINFQHEGVKFNGFDGCY